MKTARMLSRMAYAAALILAGSVPSLAADRFAVVSIANETKANITMTYQWGDGRSQSKFLAPGSRSWFSYKYARPDENRSPDFIASFDADARSGASYHEKKRLHGYRAPEENYSLGHKYVFRYNGPSKTYIELYETK
jgi:hypothetical protein